MVTFVCAQCGTSLKKNQVEKHTYQCRSSSFSCIDCNKDFIGNDYVAHTKCISEIERYSAKGWKPPANHNKGEKKQDAWITIVQDTLDKHANSISPSCRNLLHTVAKHENVPRKKPKFINFITNVGRNGFNQATINEVWDLLESEWKSAKEPPTPAAEAPPTAEESSKDESDQLNTNSTEKKKRKKKKSVGDESQEADEPIPTIEDAVENGEPTPKKKKKRAKDESKELESIPTVEETVEDGEPTPRKKKKKTAVEPLEAETVPIPEDTTVENGHGGLTPKKKKKKALGECQEPETVPTTDDTVENGHGEPIPKKKKKSKGTEVESQNGDLEVTHENGICDDGLSKKKKRKSSKVIE